MKILSILNPQETTDLVTFTEEILNGKLHFLCSVFNAIITQLSRAPCIQLVSKHWMVFAESSIDKSNSLGITIPNYFTGRSFH